MAKIPKVVAGYLPAKLVPPEGTRCGQCRDFIRSSSECMITDPAAVDPKRDTCILFVWGRPHEYGSPLRLIPASVVGLVREAPTHCKDCEYFEHPGSAHSTCTKVGDTDDDLVDSGGCCNAYQPRK